MPSPASHGYRGAAVLALVCRVALAKRRRAGGSLVSGRATGSVLLGSAPLGRLAAAGTLQPAPISASPRAEHGQPTRARRLKNKVKI